MSLLDTVSLSNINISSQTLVHTFVAMTNYRDVWLRVWLYQLTGSAARSVVPMIRRSGTAIDSRLNLTPNLSSGLTDQVFISDPFTLRNGDTLKVYVTGGGSDTTTPDVVSEIFGELDMVTSSEIANIPQSVRVELASELSKINNLPLDPSSQSLLEALINTRAMPSDVTVNLAISSVMAALVSKGVLAIEAGYTLQQTITSTVTEDLSSATKLWLAIKERSDTDANSIIFLEQTDGLTRVNKLDYVTVNHGSLVVSGSSGAWDILIHIDEVATALLFGKNGTYDAGLKAKIGNDEISIWDGHCSIVDGVVRTI